MSETLKDRLVQELSQSQEWFERSTRCLLEEDSEFAPIEGVYTASQTVAHVAQTVDWFVEGAFGAEGLNMDFPGMDAEVRKVSSLSAARDWLTRSFEQAREVIGKKSDEELHGAFPDDSLLGPMPFFAIVPSICDHTTHHRGALTIYSRLLGHTPAMPYMEG